MQAHTNWTVNVSVALRAILSLSAPAVARWRADAWRAAHRGSPGWLPRDSGCGGGGGGGSGGKSPGDGDGDGDGSGGVGGDVGGGGDGGSAGGSASEGAAPLDARGGAVFSLTTCSGGRPWAPRCREVVRLPTPSATGAGNLWFGPVAWVPCRRLSDFCEAWRWCVRDAAALTEESTRRDWRENCWQPVAGPASRKL